MLLRREKNKSAEWRGGQVAALVSVGTYTYLRAQQIPRIPAPFSAYACYPYMLACCHAASLATRGRDSLPQLRLCWMRCHFAHSPL